MPCSQKKGFDPGGGAKILHALQPKKKKPELKQQKQYYNKFNKDSKNAPCQKKF